MEQDEYPYMPPPPPPPQQVPPNVQQLAATHQLGALTTAYTKASFKVFVGSALLSLFFLIPFCSLLSSLSHSATYASGPPLLFSLFAFVCVCAAIVFVFFSYRYRQVYLYMEGLVYCTWRSVGVLRWEDIEQLSWTTKGAVSLRIRKTDGKQITFWLTFPAQECTTIYSTIENEFARVRAERSPAGD
ncbi:MAG TPA: DUF6585 family protein [Ktedonobacteraceae bacterium]|nr:DUF6585 family protein [Ktedonobacteraceae bacterium]